MNREDIYQALFDLVSAAPGLVTTSRKLLHWSDVPPSQRPALFLTQKSETAINTTGLPTKWMLSAEIYVYGSTKGAICSGEVLNPIVDAITNALATTEIGPQTLGGLVHYARIEGTIETDEGNLGDDAVAIIHVSILTAA